MSSKPLETYDRIYAPQEDSYLLLQASLAESKRDDFVLEIGCGSGIISTNLRSRVRKMVATDINPFAVKAARSKGLEVIRADLLRGFKGRFDLIIFNPPYLPTTREERTQDWINFAVDGGENGRETVERFLEGLGNHFTENGRALMLISSITGIKEVLKKAYLEDLEVRILSEKRYFFEKLYVLKIQPGKYDKN